MTEFVRQSNEGAALDGFCIQLPGDGGPETLGRRVRSVLRKLSDRDPAQENMIRQIYIGERGWRFRFAKADFSVSTFAPCYPSTSSRYAFESTSAFILLQSELSFCRHKLPPDSPITSYPPQTIRYISRIWAKLPHS